LGIHLLSRVEVGLPQVYAHRSGSIYRTAFWKKLLHPFQEINVTGCLSEVPVC